MITLILSLITEVIFLYQNRMMPFINMPGDEGALFIPIINIMMFPLLVLVNYSNSKLIHQYTNKPIKNGLLLSSIFPFIGIIFLPLLMILAPIIY